jgi:hypothetical protein
MSISEEILCIRLGDEPNKYMEIFLIEILMRLTTPIDYNILDEFSDGRRNNAANLARILDRDRSYINTRLPILAEHGLLEHVGPSPHSGLYVITDNGLEFVQQLEASEGNNSDLDALLEDQIKSE